MTWEETIKYIRMQPQHAELIEKAYLEEDLKLNVERFRVSEEYQETKRILMKISPHAKTLLDVGSGNGVSAVSFSLDGYMVTACEPDHSETVGAGAIKKLKNIYQIPDLEVIEKYAEDLQNFSPKFDIIYARQVMHHANNLMLFVKNLAGMLKPGGVLLTVRDHVILDEIDKELFLKSHPLQAYYGGENAFKEEEYVQAIRFAELKLIRIIKHFDSVINYFPLTKSGYKGIIFQKELELKSKLMDKIGFLGKFPLIFLLYKRKVGFSKENIFNQLDFPGRLYSFLAQKCL